MEIIWIERIYFLEASAGKERMSARLYFERSDHGYATADWQR